jgi:hypothetical protein
VLTAQLALGPGTKLDRELAVEGIRDSLEGVDPRRAAAALQARDRRLGGVAQLCELHLGEPELTPAVAHLARDLREQPALLGAGEALTDPFERALRLLLTHIASVVYSR